MGSSEVNLIYLSVYSEDVKSSSFKMPAFFMCVHESTNQCKQEERALAVGGKKANHLIVFGDHVLLWPGTSLQLGWSLSPLYRAFSNPMLCIVCLWAGFLGLLLHVQPDGLSLRTAQPCPHHEVVKNAVGSF